MPILTMRTAHQSAAPEKRVESARNGARLDTLSEDALFSASRKGDVDAFARLYGGYRRQLYAVCLKVLRDPALAEDVVQETFLRAFTHIEQFETGRALWPWLVGIAEHRCVDILRRHRRVVLVDEAPEPWATVGTGFRPSDATADAVVALEDRARLKAALAALPSRQRRALLLYALEGWTYEQIAQAEGISLVAIKSLIFRARTTLKEACQSTKVILLLAPFNVARTLRRRPKVIPLTSMGESVVAFSGSQVAVILVALAMALTSGLPETSPPPDGSPDRRPAVVAGAAGDAHRDGARSAQDEVRLMGSREDGGGWPLIDETTDPNQNVQQPEDARITTVAFSPNFAEDHTIFAAGRRAEVCRPRCPPVLFRSTDGGWSWVRLEARGFEGIRAILLPPGFGRNGEGRIFAMGLTGLQVSENGGKTFDLVTAAAGLVVGSAAISPAFNVGDPQIVIGAQTLTSYRADLRSFHPAPYTAIPGPLEPVFSPAYARDGVLLAGGMVLDPVDGWSSAIFRCSVPVCERTVVQSPGATPRIRLSPDFVESGAAVAFTEQSLFLTGDGARSFRRVLTPWKSGTQDVAFAGEASLLVAAVSAPDGTAESGLYLSEDAGASWTRLSHPLLNDRFGALSGSGSRLMATRSRGVVCSVDSGRTWHRRCSA